MSEISSESLKVRKIIHVDMDAFFASVEQRDFPHYRGKAIVVGGSPEKRGVVAAASYEARKYGIHSAMSSYKAMKLCPHLIFVRGRFEAYREASDQIHEIFLEFTDQVEPMSMDEAYLDVTENKLGYTSATAIAEDIRKRIFDVTGLTASAGVSYNKFLAKTGSGMNKPNGLCVIPPHKATSVLEALPIHKFHGIGKATAERMHELGIRTGADLKTFNQEALYHCFGKSGLYYYDIVRGIDHREVEVTHERKSIGSETTFYSDLDDLNELKQKLDEQCDEVLEWMNKRSLFGRTLTVKVKYSDFQQVTRSQTFDNPLNNKAFLYAMAYALMLKTDAGDRKVRLVGVSVSNFGEIAKPKAQPVLQLKLAV